ncbi:OmpH family outer membrane protein [Oceanithermus sp.]
MKRTAIITAALLMAMVGVLGLSQNKDIPSRVGYIDAQKVIEAHPKYAEVKKLQEQADKELKPLVDQLNALDAKIKAGTATDKDRRDFQTLQKAYVDASKQWQDKINAVLGPITKDIDKTISIVAAQNGFSMIFSANIAGQSGLIVYASPDVDVTDLVIRALASQ